MSRRPPRSTRTDTLFPYTTLFRSVRAVDPVEHGHFSCPADTHRLGASFHPMSDLNMGLGRPGEGTVLSFGTSGSGWWLFKPAPLAIPNPRHIAGRRR